MTFLLVSVSQQKVCLKRLSYFHWNSFSFVIPISNIKIFMTFVNPYADNFCHIFPRVKDQHFHLEVVCFIWALRTSLTADM